MGFVIFVIVLLRSHVQMENQLDVRRAMLSTQIAEMTREAALSRISSIKETDACTRAYRQRQLNYSFRVLIYGGVWSMTS